jgi:hypothetical protein
MVALPSELPLPFNSPSIRDAYTRILKFEASLRLVVASGESQGSTQANPEDNKKLIYARILGYLILEGPTYIAKEAVAREVNSCLGENEMSNLGEFYLLHFIRPCKLQFFCLFFAFWKVFQQSESIKAVHPLPLNMPHAPPSTTPRK